MSTLERVAVAAEAIAESQGMTYRLSDDRLECAIAIALREAFQCFASKVRELDVTS